MLPSDMMPHVYQTNARCVFSLPATFTNATWVALQTKAHRAHNGTNGTQAQWMLLGMVFKWHSLESFTALLKKLGRKTNVNEEKKRNNNFSQKKTPPSNSTRDYLQGGTASDLALWPFVCVPNVLGGCGDCNNNKNLSHYIFDHTGPRELDGHPLVGCRSGLGLVSGCTTLSVRFRGNINSVPSK